MPPGSHWFHDVVSALAYSLAEPQALTAQLNPPFNDLTQFILQQHAQMPDYLRAPLRLAALGFDINGLLRSGRRFHRQAPRTRQQQIAAWKNSNLSFQRDLIRYFESLATLALHSRDEPKPQCVARSPHGNIIEKPSADLRAQIVVVGSGPGGAVTACLLAEAGHDVLLIEEGPFLPLDSCAPFTKCEMLQKYRNGGQTVALGRNKIAYVEGRCVGGGSEINSGLYHRTPLEILDRWRREFQADGVTEHDLVPHFEACERDLSVSTLAGPAPKASLKLHEGAMRLGWASLEVPRWFRHDRRHDGQIAEQRQSMTETYIPRFFRAGGKLLPCTRVNRLRASGAEWSLIGRHDLTGPMQIRAEQLFLCAGAIQTPALLRRSGITRNIGNSLQVHPTVKLVAKFPESVNTRDMGVPVHQVKEFAPRLSFGCSVSSPAYLALGLQEHPKAMQEVPREWHRMAAYYAMITSEGHGSIRSLPGFGDPLVRYSLTETDRRNLAEGVFKLGEILFAAGAVSIFPSVVGAPELVDPSALKKLPGALPNGLASLMTVHLFSSCPMGEDQSRCAVNSFGRVHDFKNLFVNDASLLCTAPGVNPQGSIMAIARRNALRFLGK